ncbi:Ger(x)C family spore germination protein [Paenibacillus oenotherae]|uniref:Ger(X)C family spore germination protein n=1 Tax=Paenibacillus oenotherae TaxID=1435645 RepID=A0ABS7D8E4_9BACL|nr:Ger(x)C family spore germination protein [Paenibacillus oenotherae]MBW7476145.1 Ger(x)C family spore germination protein [Paenibacillus oenotherae]
MKYMPLIRAKVKLLLLIATISPVLSGCWDSSNLENLEYITAIGIDRQEEKFIFYAQLIDLSTIAKTEGGAKKDKIPNWIGRGEGITIYDAYSKLLRSAQSEISLEQLKVVVVHEHAMDFMTEILDALNRVRVARYTSWMFGTRGRMMDIFNASLVLERSQLHSLLYNPQQQMKSNTFVQPLNMQKFVAQFTEKAVTALLPSILATEQTWHENESRIKVGMIDGLFAFKAKKKQYYDRDLITGIRWFNPRFSRHLLAIKDESGKHATVMVVKSKSKVDVSFKQGKPIFTIRMKLQGELAETDGQITFHNIIAGLEKRVQEEVLQVYAAGVKQGVDLLNLDERLFRYHHKEWKKLAEKGGWHPQPGELRVDVHCVLKHSGSFIMD